MNPSIYITINHTELFGDISAFRVGDVLTLQKDYKNEYDDEAIVVTDQLGIKKGYVANSTASVARGTYSAGRLYDRLNDHLQCIICFITHESVIAQIT